MKVWKKAISMVALSAMLMSFAACSSQSQETTGGQESKPATEAETKKEQNPQGQEGKASDDVWSKLRIVTEDYPPHNYKDKDGKVAGTSTKKIQEAMKKMNVNVPIEIQPWARSYQDAQEKENTLIYSMGRNAERESKFKWIAPVSSIKVYMYSLADNTNVKVEKLDDAKKYKIGTMTKDFTEQGLQEKGFKTELVSSPKQEQSLRQLFEKRIDLWVATVEGDTLNEMVKKEGLDPSKLKAAFEIKDLQTDLWLAASLKTPDEVVAKFKENLAK